MTSKLEYLKRYEGTSSSVKKKKKIKKLTNFKILDDDASWGDPAGSEDRIESHIEDPEDAPVVAQVRDDSVVMWQPLSVTGDESRRKKSSPVSDNDLSPPRLQKRPTSFIGSKGLSPPRKFWKGPSHVLLNEDEDISPPRREKHAPQIQDSDLSPPRARRKPHQKHIEKARANDIINEDLSPLRSFKNISDDAEIHKCEDNNPSPGQRKPKYSQVDSSASKFRHGQRTSEKHVTHCDKFPKDSNSKAAVASESYSLSKLSANNSSKVVSDADAEKISSDEKQFMQWGRGVVQTRGALEKAKDEEYEMSKPLARYADDEDLDKMLKEQTREGDPMLLFMKKSKTGKEKDAQAHKGKPCYKGNSAPNRFGIRPGYRWDGVDRSNGYEKAWLSQASNKKAIAEESYKWSTEDM